MEHPSSGRRESRDHPMKYRVAAAICLIFALWQTPRSPAYAFLGYAGAGIAAVGYASNRGGIEG